MITFAQAVQTQPAEARTENNMKAMGVDTKTGELKYGNDIDPRYFNVSVEQIDFAPISLEEVNKRIVEQGGHVGFRNGNGPIM